MRILWIIKKYFDKASDRTVRLEMIKHLRILGNEVTLITGFKDETPSFGLGDAIKYVPSIKKPGFNAITFLFFSYLYTLFYIFKNKPDVVILDFWTFWIGFPFDVIARLRGRPRFFVDMRTFHYGLKSDTFSVLDHVLRFLTDVSMLYSKYLHAGMTVITPELKRQVLSRYRFRGDRVGIWASGVSVETFNPRRLDVEDVPRELKRLRDKFVVMHHGSLSFNRGLLETVEAVSQLKDRYSNIVFLLLGDGIAKGKIVSLAETLNLKDSFFFVGQVSHEVVPYYINVSHVGIMAYPDIEYWKVNNPIKLLEYLAMEKPVIVTDSIAFREVIGTTECGIFLDSQDPPTIAKAILYAYERRDELEEMGKRGRRIVEEGYTWAKQAERLDAFLRGFA